MDEKKNNNKKYGFTIYGDIHVAGPMFEIHDNGTVYIDGIRQNAQKKEAEHEDPWVIKELKFFDMQDFGTAEKQQMLARTLRMAAMKIDTSNGRDWFGHYAAYRYAKEQVGVSGGYVDFFSDIEMLIPDMLQVENPNVSGDRRYKNYTKGLGKEVKAWYVDELRLPPISNLAYRSYAFGCNETRFKRMKGIISELYKWIIEQNKVRTH